MERGHCKLLVNAEQLDSETTHVEEGWSQLVAGSEISHANTKHLAAIGCVQALSLLRQARQRAISGSELP